MARFVFTPYMGERIPGVWLRLEQSVARFVFTRTVHGRENTRCVAQTGAVSGQVCAYT